MDIRYVVPHRHISLSFIGNISRLGHDTILHYFSSSLHHLVSERCTETERKKSGLLFFTSVVCSHHVSLIHQMQKKTPEAHAFLVSPYTHHPMKTGAPVLLNCIAQWIISLPASPDCISLSPNQSHTPFLKNGQWRQNFNFTHRNVLWQYSGIWISIAQHHIDTALSCLSDLEMSVL